MERFRAFLEKASCFVKEKVAGIKASPPALSEKERLLLKRVIEGAIIFLLAVLGIKIAVELVLWALAKLVQFWTENQEAILFLVLIIASIVGTITNWLYSHREQRDAKRKEALLREEQKALDTYASLRVFMYELLDERLCRLLEFVKPITPNQLEPTTPITVDDRAGVIYYNFQVYKEKTTPFSQGTEYVKSLLASYVAERVRRYGIEGVTPPLKDEISQPIYVDAVKDRGSTAVIVLALDSEAYRRLKDRNGTGTGPHSLIEHI